MRIGLDTSVLIAATVRPHPHHAPAYELLAKIRSGEFRGFVSTHGLAEYYSVLTRAPFIPRIQPADAGRFLEDNILACFEVVPLTADDYRDILLSCSQTGKIGGAVYDLLHIRAAMKSECERLYTFNVREFRLLAPELADKITAP